MATSYPGAFDALTNPTASDPLTSPSHAAQHTNANDAIEALQVRAGLTGTSFPGSPATGARFLRTDRNLEYFYDGTRWLTTTQFHVVIPALLNTLNNSSTGGRLVGPASGGASWYVERLDWTAYVITTNDGSNYWTCQLESFDGATGPTNVGSAMTTQSLAPDQYHSRSTTSVAGVLSTSIEELQFSIGKTAAPGTLILVSPTLVYRLVG